MASTKLILHSHHIVPKHVGGTDDPSNLIKVNIAMHAFLHELLYQEHGRLEDKLAADGLRGLIPKQQIVQEILSMQGHKLKAFNTGRKRPKQSKLMSGGNNPAARPVVIHGKWFPSAVEAGHQYNCSGEVIRKRIKKEKEGYAYAT